MRYRNKIRVFISSACNSEPFDSIRKKLKQKIDNTNFAQAYLYEEDSASSLPNQNVYLYELDDCHVCIFLIDTSVDLPLGVQTEVTRTKAKNIKSLFVFKRSEPEPKIELQKELEQSGNLKYYEINSFEDFPEEAYQALLNDVTKVYAAYCRNIFEDNTDTPQSKSLEEITTDFSEVLDKQIIKNIDKTKRRLSSEVIKSEISDPFLSQKELSTSELDQLAMEFLDVLLSGKSIRNFNVSILLDTLKEQQSNQLYSVVEIRWKAIQAYFSGDLKMCLTHLKKAFSIADAHKLPQWIMSDILIDTRNMEIQISTRNNREKSPAGQIALENNQQVLYYPLIDRFAKEYYDKIDKNYVKDTIRSPYSIEIASSIDGYIDIIASIYMVAMFNGSLTHILLLWNYFYDLAVYLCSKYDDWEVRILLLKNAFLVESSTNIKLLMTTFNDTIGKMNAADAIDIYKYTYNQPVKYKRFAAQLKVLIHLGYYFSDEDYNWITESIIADISAFWEKPIVFQASIIFEFFRNNHLRLNNSFIADSCIKVFDKQYKRFFDDMLKTFCIIDFNKIPKESSERIMSIIQQLLQSQSAEDKNYYNNELEKIVVNLKRSFPQYYKEIASVAETVFAEALKETCGFEQNDRLIVDSIIFIQKYIDQIKGGNDKQGKDGLYYESGINPYGTIINILSNNKIEVPLDLAESIINVATETILLDRQTIKNKIFAFHLLFFLRTYTFSNSQLDSLFDNSLNLMDQNEKRVLEENNGFFDQYTSSSIKTNWLFFKIACNKATNVEIIESLAAVNSLAVFEKIETMKALSLLFENNYVYIISTDILDLLLQFVLSYCSDDTHDLRFFAIKSLLGMVTESNHELIASQLYMSMDFDNSYIKNLILRRLPKMTQMPDKVKDYIISKAKTDNHFYIRKQANEIENH